MEIILNKLSFTIAQRLYKKNKRSNIQNLELLFGIKILIYNISIVIFIIIFSLIANTLAETVLILIIFTILRHTAGGLHFNSIEKCVTATTLIIMSGSTLSKYIEINLSTCLFLCIFINILFFTYTPIGTKDKPFTPEYTILQKKRLRIISLCLTLLTLVSTTLLRKIVIISMCLEIITLLPNYFHKLPHTV